MNRRHFLTRSTIAAGGLLLPTISWAKENVPQKLVILHTNDVHSRLDPYPMDGSKYQGLGGVAARAALIESIRAQEEHVLLLDAGDMFQGTPYFNLYKGEPEIKAMAAMKYDACTIGNHDFDAGLENLATQMRLANFPMLVCNYDFTGTAMEHQTLPYTIIHKGPLKIGIFGLGIEMKGLVPAIHYGSTIYEDPIVRANQTADLLKHNKKCDMIICLSHLGYQYRGSNKISDKILAAETSKIDLIIGGHTHTFMTEPEVVKNKTGGEVVINQVGWGGLILGRLDYTFYPTNKKKFTESHTLPIAEKTSI
ncbi:MAG TPA: metallophosphatase [Phnomibacter sp.]|nr:metallophosphatase [Phnomibacter sp.]